MLETTGDLGDGRLSRRKLLALGAALPFIGPSPSAAQTRSNGRLSVGVSGPSYYNGFSPFINWWKQAAPVQLSLADGTSLAGKAAWDSGFLDPATGDLMTPVPGSVTSISRLFFASAGNFQTSVGADYSGEPFQVEWEGHANVRIDWLTEGGSQRPMGPNQLAFTLGKVPGNTAVTFTILDSNDPPRNIRIFQSRYAAEAGDREIFNPDWVNAIAPFGVVRCMDWCAVNNTTVTDFDQLAGLSYASWAQPFRAVSDAGEQGPKGGVHPEILCQLGMQIDGRLHVCIPHLATDDFIERFASYLRDNLKKEVIFELSNECWNASFSQFSEYQRAGEAIWPNDPSRGYKYYGYRAAHCLNIVRKVYADIPRWRGAMATQTVNPAVTESIFAGVEHWIANRPQKTEVAFRDLFHGLYVTGYFGEVTSCTQPVAILRSSPAVVVSPAHGYETGDRIQFFVSLGMTELDNREFVVTRIDQDSYAIGADAREFSAYVNDTRNYAVSSVLFRLMDESKRRHQSAGGEYPTPYDFFIQQVTASLMTGTSKFGFGTSVSVKSLYERHWPAQLALARSRGLDLCQYEGGCHLTGDAYLSGYGGNPKYSEYIFQLSHSPEIAVVYSAMFKSFSALGGCYPSKFLADGQVSQFGAWAGIRFWPTSANRNQLDDNPVWKAVRMANAPALQQQR